MWKLRYFSRVLFEKMLDISGIEVVEEKIKDAVGRHEKISNEFIRKRIAHKLDLLHEPPFNEAMLVREQGTGWHGIDLFAFYLAGKAVYTSDVRDLLRVNLLRRVIQTLEEDSYLVSAYTEKIDALSLVKNSSRESILSTMGVTYEVAERIGSVVKNADLVYTDSVLQRMTPEDLEALVYHGGVNQAGSRPTHWHRVDCKDFQSIRNHSVPPLFYLTVRERLWNTLTSKRLNYQNRWRMDNFVSLFEKYGYTVHVEAQTPDPEDIEYLNRANLDEPFREITPEANAVKRFDLIAR